MLCSNPCGCGLAVRAVADDDEEELLLKLMSEHSTGFTPKKTKPATQSSGKAAAVKPSAGSSSSVRPASSNNQVRTLPLATHTRETRIPGLATRTS